MHRGRSTFLWRSLVLVLTLWNLTAPCHAVEPEIRNLNVRGLQIGGTTTVILDGEALGTAPRLLLSFPAKQTLKPGGTDKKATFEVSLEKNVPPGYGHLRVVTDGGVSLPVRIGVDRLPQLPLGTTVATLPVALHGVSTGSTTAEARFSGKAGQKILVEVEAQRLGSKLRPVLHLYSPRKVQLAWSWPTSTLQGDTRLEATLPDDGEYTLSVHDVEYAGQNPGYFRIKVGTWTCVDQVFPPVVSKTQKSVELLGPTGVTQLDLPTTRHGVILPLPWPTEGLWSGPRPYVEFSSRTEIVEQPNSTTMQVVPAGPAGISGKLSKPGEEDRYRVTVKPGSKIRFEVFAERLGSPLDVTLVLRNEKGNDLARAEDGPNTLDPVLDFKVPEQMTSLIVALVDSQQRGGPRATYRMTIDPLGEPSQEASFRLLTPARRITLPTEGRSVTPVLIEREGYEGSVELSSPGLPPGVTLQGTTIPPGGDGTLLTMVRGAGPSQTTLATLVGHDARGLERRVRLTGETGDRFEPWLAEELAIAPTSAKASDFQLDWGTLPSDLALVPGSKPSLPVKVLRPAGNTLVRLTLLTSQLTPLVNNRPDVNQTIRLAKAVELGAKVDKGEVPLLLPLQLTAPLYDVAIQGELLSADRRTVLATAFTPVKRLPVRLPLLVHLKTPARFETRIDPKKGSVVEVKGTIDRREGFKGDVPVTITGLPPGVRADTVIVKDGLTDFTLKLTLPPNLPPGEIKGLKLSGAIAPDTRQANQRVKSRDIELTLIIQVPAK